jgi:hypothetical protein
MLTRESLGGSGLAALAATNSSQVTAPDAERRSVGTP